MGNTQTANAYIVIYMLNFTLFTLYSNVDCVREFQRMKVKIDDCRGEEIGQLSFGRARDELAENEQRF